MKVPRVMRDRRERHGKSMLGARIVNGPKVYLRTAGRYLHGSIFRRRDSYIRNKESEYAPKADLDSCIRHGTWTRTCLSLIIGPYQGALMVLKYHKWTTPSATQIDAQPMP